MKKTNSRTKGLLSYEEAFERMMARAAVPRLETVPIQAALGRIVAADLATDVDLPPFSNSAMDGFAVRSRDTRGAAAKAPVRLAVVGDSAAGRPYAATLKAGQAVSISTGAAIPRGADTVVKSEDVAGRPAGRSGMEAVIELAEAVRVGHNIRRQGEDLPAGSVGARKGCRLDPAIQAVLVGGGLGELQAYARRTAGVCATGSELTAAGRPLAPGHIYESGATQLHALMSSTPAEALHLGMVEDEPARIRAALGEALERFDVLCVCGGVSIGIHDHVRPILRKLGVDEIFWGVRTKPGKPLFFGAHARGWVFGVPGNPVSTLASYVLFIEPFLRAVSGCRESLPIRRRATAAVSLRKKTDRREFVTARVFVGSSGLGAVPIEGQGSHMLHSMRGANGFIVIPEEVFSVEAGAEVDVVLFPFFRETWLFGDECRTR